MFARQLYERIVRENIEHLIFPTLWLKLSKSNKSCFLLPPFFFPRKTKQSIMFEYFSYVLWHIKGKEILLFFFFKSKAQYRRLQNAATPALIHFSESAYPWLFRNVADFAGISIHIIKLVECPVVDNVPVRRFFFF